MQITPANEYIAYEGFFNLQKSHASAFGERPVSSIFAPDCPSACVIFRTGATTGEVLLDYLPRSDLGTRNKYRSTGMLFQNQTPIAEFTRPPEDAKCLVRIPFGSKDKRPATYRLICPYADVVRFRGIELNDGASLLTVPEHQRPVYVAYGDSITQGFRGDKPTSGFAWQLAQHMDWQLFNLGFGSRVATPEDMNLLLAPNPDVVSILFGVNECLQEVPVVTYTASLKQIIQRIRRASPETCIILITPLTVPGDWPKTANLEQYRQAVNVLTNQLLDPNLLLVQGPELIPNDTALFDDGLHPNDEGFAIMAKRLSATITAAPTIISKKNVDKHDPQNYSRTCPLNSCN